MKGHPRVRVSSSREKARRLRREQTDAERKLWSHLRSRQLEDAKFRRQHPIGQFIADFCCPERRVVVEVDGGHHAKQTEADNQRTAFLVARGYRVLRFWDNDVLANTDAVVEQIAQAVREAHPTPPQPSLLPPRGRRNR